METRFRKKTFSMSSIILFDEHVLIPMESSFFCSFPREAAKIKKDIPPPPPPLANVYIYACIKPGFLE